MMQRLPYRLQKRGGELLNQQCWLWGQDVRHAEGNVLVALGFCRVPVPPGETGCTQYYLGLPGGDEVRLWGFGVRYGGPEGVYLNRYSFAPVCAPRETAAWTAEAFAGLPASQDVSTVISAVRWIAGCEQAIQQGWGVGYRERCLYGWGKRALPPRDLLEAWNVLARDLQRFADRVASQMLLLPA